MKTKCVMAAIAAFVLGGCAPVVVAPPSSAPMPAYQQPAPAPAMAEQFAVPEEEGAPPVEFMAEQQPIFYDQQPGVAFWPVFFGMPGSCLCIMPVYLEGGVFYGPGAVVVMQREAFVYYRPGPAHLHSWHESRGTWHGHAGVRGTMERGPGGRMHVVAPAGVHAQQHQQRQAAKQQQRPPQEHHQQPTPQAQPPRPQAQPQGNQPTTAKGQLPRPQASPQAKSALAAKSAPPARSAAPQGQQQQRKPPQMVQQQRPALAAKAPPKKSCGGKNEPKC